MKKKQRCFVKRFAALVAALMLCVSLCVPVFASNNAQWRKWVITSERNLTNESGTSSKYFQLTPFYNGEIYAAVLGSYYTEFRFPNSPSGNEYGWDMSGLYVCNYPDWWRSAIPLGAVSYIQVDVKTLSTRSTPNGSDTSATSAGLYIFDRHNSIAFSYDVEHVGTSAGTSGALSQFSPSSPFFLTDAGNSYAGNSGATSLGYISVSSGSSYLVNLSQMENLVIGPVIKGSDNTGIGFSRVPLMNLSSDDIIIAVSRWTSGQYTYCTAEISYWVDANKLSPGLKVGDEFPADSDAFDELRETLIDQFPEASENIENGKSTLTGWNDTETVDSDVASTSMSALNAMFQNLGSFLFIVSLMVFGAVVLRMFIKKAVDG